MFINDHNSKISDLQLKISLWFITHKLLLKKIGIGTLITGCVCLYGFSIVSAINILVFQKNDYQTLLTDLAAEPIDYGYWHDKQGPADLELSELKIFNSTAGRKDLVALIKNPNQNFLVRNLKYQFIKDGAVLAENQTHLWPGQTKPLVAFGVSGISQSAAVSVQLVEIQWQRVKQPAEFEDFLAAREQFVFSDIEFIPSSQSPAANQPQSSRVEFVAQNQTIFDFWEVGFYVLLYNGSNLVGANYLEEPEFKSMESRSVAVVWFNPLSAVTRTEIIPELNVLDPGVYLESGMEVGEEK